MANINGFNITFERFNNHLHLYTVQGLHDKLLEYKDYCLQSFNKDVQESEQIHDSYNTPLMNGDFYDDFKPVFYGILDHYYVLSETWEDKVVGIYVQDPKHSRPIRHNHSKDGVLTATFYIDPIENEEEGGGLEFYLGSGEHDSFTIYPKKDVIYMFPAWALHSPLPQTREQPRICLNWGYDCSQRPVHKLTGNRW